MCISQHPLCGGQGVKGLSKNEFNFDLCKERLNKDLSDGGLVVECLPAVS